MEKFKYVNTHYLKIGEVNNWRHWHFQGCDAVYKISNRELLVDIIEPGKEFWAIQLQQSGFKLETGKTYKLVLSAKTTISHKVEIVFKTQQDQLYYSNIFDLTDEVTSYEFEFTVDKPTNQNMQLAIYLGNSPKTELILKEIALFVLVDKLDTTPPVIIGADKVINLGSSFNPLHGIVVYDNNDFDLEVSDLIIEGEVNTNVLGEYQLKYFLSDKSGNQTTLIRTITVEDFPPVDFHKSLKVLAIGNSFSVDSMEYLWDIANNYGVREIILGNLYIGGCTLKTHNYNAKHNLSAYTYYKNTSGTWFSIDSISILDALVNENWDLISIQQASGPSGLISTYNEDLLELIDYVKSNKSNIDAKIIWNMTWSYSCDSHHHEFINYENNQITMYNAIVNTVKKVIVNNQDIVLVIPTGTAIQNIRSSYFGDTLTRDGFHLSLDIGRFVAGLTWFKAITGFSIEDITYLPDGVTKDKLLVIKEAVNKAIKSPFVITNI